MSLEIYILLCLAMFVIIIIIIAVVTSLPNHDIDDLESRIKYVYDEEDEGEDEDVLGNVINRAHAYHTFGKQDLKKYKF